MHRPAEVADGSQQVARHVGDRPVRAEWDALRSTVGVLGDRVMGVQVERNDQRAGAVGSRQRQGLPPACAEAQRGVLELRLFRGEGDRELAEDLRVRVQRVAGCTPRLVGKRRPRVSHSALLSRSISPQSASALRLEQLEVELDLHDVAERDGADAGRELMTWLPADDAFAAALARISQSTIPTSPAQLRVIG